uniref:RHS repeat domain-containing protein n=1 Tax=Fulvivirga sp. TaxID=1931237 RepID=UPI004049F713
QLNDFSFPISMSYSSSGLKPDETPSWVGMGWTLNATGVITRQRRGLEDESKNGYNGLNRKGKEVVKYINGELNDSEEETFKEALVDGLMDGEPDIFFYNAGTYSGKFFFDETQCDTELKRPIIIPDRNISINAEFDYYYTYNIEQGSIRSFKILDENGVEYVFASLEAPSGSKEKGDPSRDNFVNTWFLSSITTPNGNQIDFNYEYRDIDLPAAVSEQRYLAIEQNPEFRVNNPYRRNTFRSTTSEAILKSITYNGGRIEFIEGEERSDWDVPLRYATTKPKSLKEIKVFGYQNEEIKTIRFNYNNNVARLQLGSFQEFLNGKSISPGYTFEYQGGAIPQITDAEYIYGQDYWGYYNGRSQNTLLPSYATVGYNFSDPSETNLVEFKGVDRSPSPTRAKAGMLTKVNYPTGGFTRFEYEGNQYLEENPNDPDFEDTAYNPCGDLTELVKAKAGGTVQEDYNDFELEFGSCIELTYRLEARCIGAEAYVHLYDLNGYKQLFTERAKKAKDGNIESVGNTEQMFLKAGSYRLVVWADIEHCEINLANASVKGLKPKEDDNEESQPVNFSVGGLRVSKVESCPGYDQSCTAKRYLYVDENNPSYSSGELINFPNLVQRKTIYFDGGDDEMAGFRNIEIDYAVLSATSNVPLATTSGSFVGYNTVIEINGEDESNGKIVHKFLSRQDHQDVGSRSFPYPPLGSNDWKRGKEKQTIIYNAEGQKLQESQSEFSVQPHTSYARTLGVKFGNIQEDPSSLLPRDIRTQYVFAKYQIITGFQYLKEQVQTEYQNFGTDNELSHSKKTEYKYDNSIHLLPTETISTINGDEKIKTVFKYTLDADDIEGLSEEALDAVNALEQQRIHTALLQKQIFRDDELIETSQTTYKRWYSTRAYPNQVKTAIGNNDFVVKSTFLEYDINGNLLSYTPEKLRESGNNLVTSFKWDYDNLYPVAKVVNATQDEFSYESFELIGNTAEAHTGKKGFQGVHPVSLSKPGEYKLSYYELISNKWQYQEQTINSNTSIGSATSIIDDVRLVPVDANITTYTYKPGFGITSEMDNNGKATTYEYDEAGRLKLIKDYEGNILKSYSYGYQKK